MKKELVYSTLGHLILLIVLIVYPKPATKGKLPLEIFQVSLVNLQSSLEGKDHTPNLAVISEPKPKSKVTTKPKSAVEKKPVVKQSSDLGLKLSSEGGKYSYYIEAILVKIGSNWVNPYQGAGLKLSTTIFFVIKKDGTITSTKIEKSSGNELFDVSAERAVIVTKTLPPLAGEFAHLDSLVVHLEFEYKP
ncbi:MAG: energy transducer TonB [candidate division WOR-3 bacterium]